MQETCVQHKTLLGGKRGIPIYPPSKPSHRPKGRQHWGLWISNRPKAVPKPSQNALGRPKRRETVLIMCPEAGRQDSVQDTGGYTAVLDRLDRENRCRSERFLFLGPIWFDLVRIGKDANTFRAHGTGGSIQ